MKNSTHIQSFADNLKNLVDGDLFSGQQSKQDKEVTEILSNVQLLSEINARLAKEIEFFEDKVISTETFLKRYKEIQIEFEPKLAQFDK